MLLHLSDGLPETLHHQLSRQLRSQILAGQLPEGTRLPSIRKMATEQKVSIVTVQRAYIDLEREGLIQARSTKGYVVMAISQAQKQSIAQERLVKALEPVVQTALADGLSPEEIKAVFEQVRQRYML